jgi:hypothetical protein
MRRRCRVERHRARVTMNAARRESVPALLGVVAEGDVKGRAATVVHVSHGDLKNSLLSRLPVLTTSAQRCSACASSPGPCIPRNNLMGPHSRVREKNWRLQRQIPETSYCLCHGFFFFCFFFSGRRNAQLSKKKKKKKKKKKAADMPAQRLEGGLLFTTEVDSGPGRSCDGQSARAHPPSHLPLPLPSGEPLPIQVSHPARGHHAVLLGEVDARADNHKTWPFSR